MADRLHVAIMTVPAFGHVTPVLGTATELVRRGHRVTFLTSDEFAAKAAATGAEVVRYDFSPAMKPGEKFTSADAWDALRDIPSHAEIVSSAAAAIGSAPDVIAFDATMWVAGRTLVKSLDKPALQLYPCFASNEHFSLITDVTEASTEDADEPDEPAGEEGIGVEFFVALEKFLADAGAANVTVEEFFAGEEPRLVFLPKQFQFAGETFDDSHVFVGPCVDDRAPEPGNWSPPGDGRPIVLISLGTSSFNRHPEFFRDCARAFADLPWHVVMTLGGGVRPEELEPLPANVEAHNWVPHTQVLQHASVFVTAAGMGSVLESLHCGTPLVVVPQHGEQRVNSQRVVELGLGKRLLMEEVTGEVVRDAVLAVGADQGIGERVRTMQQDIQAAGGAARAADYIESIARG
ncbi:MGT family glycosyltransferase [Kutzneria viridogrisea]|uniref:MGT family glycosyltransferase n=1 Tax=Kutzneria viridogrisea TaxID=47990 RepID=A0ABR6BE15_9PSEU|nr:MGT family glycosyltransferase [Kutzneria viridogrisea]